MLGSLCFLGFQKTTYSFPFRNLTKEEKYHIIVSTEDIHSRAKPRVV